MHPQRTQYKINPLCYKCMTWLLRCISVTVFNFTHPPQSPTLRYASDILSLQIPGNRLSTAGSSAFSVFGPSTWNDHDSVCALRFWYSQPPDSKYTVNTGTAPSKLLAKTHTVTQLERLFPLPFLLWHIGLVSHKHLRHLKNVKLLLRHGIYTCIYCVEIYCWWNIPKTRSEAKISQNQCSGSLYMELL